MLTRRGPLMAKHHFRGWTSFSWSSQLGNSMRPPCAPLDCYLKQMKECCFHKFQGDNMLENKWWNRGYSGLHFPALLLCLRGLVCWLLLYGIPNNLGWNNLSLFLVLADAVTAFSYTQNRHSFSNGSGVCHLLQSSLVLKWCCHHLLYLYSGLY